MRLLVVIDSLGVGGAEMSLVDVLPKLKEYNVDPFVAITNTVSDLKPNLENQGIKVYILPRRNKWLLLSRARDLALLSRLLDVDLIHSHLYFSNIYTCLAKLFFLSGVRTLVTFHNLAYDRHANRRNVKSFMKRKIASFLYKRGFDGYIAISNSVKEHYHHYLKLPVTSVISNGIDFSIFEPYNSIAADRFLCVVPGRLVPEKGHASLIDAIEVMGECCLDVKIVFAGGGPLFEKLSRSVKDRNLQSVISITGVLERVKLLQLVNRARIVIIPSVAEGFGIAALEAMFLGKAIIASNVGGLGELIIDRESGVLVTPNDPRALALEIQNLLSNDVLISAYGKAARQRAFDRFTLDRQVKALFDTYQSILLKG